MLNHHAISNETISFYFHFINILTFVFCVCVVVDADSLGGKHSKAIDYRKYRRKIFRRRNSTGSLEVMNSHAVNLQTSGHQSVVVGHHRGFSQPSTVPSGGDPWFLQAHEMPPTAPARHHKRPAPQPGSILHNNNNNNVGSQSNHQLSQLQHHHSAVSVVALNLCNPSKNRLLVYQFNSILNGSIIFCSQIFSQLTNLNPLHSSSIALGNPQLSLATSANLSSSTTALEQTIQMASNAHSPKSPNQMASVQPHVHNASQTNQQTSQHANTTTSFRLNLDTTDQIPHLHQNGGTTTGSAVTSLHQATPVHVPSVMSTSLHSGSNAATGFDATTTTWNSTSSLSPTISSSAAQHHRKLEVKLNAMPYVSFLPVISFENYLRQ